MHHQMLRNVFLDPGRLFVKELDLTNTVDMNSAPTVRSSLLKVRSSRARDARPGGVCEEDKSR